MWYPYVEGENTKQEKEQDEALFQILTKSDAWFQRRLLKKFKFPHLLYNGSN